jgi:4,5-DOPA dioxygenase extradiol
VNERIVSSGHSMAGRRAFLTSLAAGTAALLPLGCTARREPPVSDDPETNMPERSDRPMPVVFVGHGSPMNVVEDNRWSRGFRELGTLLPRPRAILAISAHWFVDGTYLTDNTQPRTIYDFSGFPQALYEVEYRAPGSVDLATRVRGMIGDQRAQLRSDWGLDHGTWSVLHWMYPAADIPVVQLSMDRRLPARGHYTLGRSLAALRHEGVLILASGNVVHNLRDAFQRMQSGNTETPPWAARFDQTVAQALTQRDTEALLGLWPSEDGALAHPSPDHWWPLLYAYGATEGSDTTRFPLEGFDLGSLSMRNVIIG